MVASFCSICRFLSLSSSLVVSSSDTRLLTTGSSFILSNSSPFTSSNWRSKPRLPHAQLGHWSRGSLWLPCFLTWSFFWPSSSDVQLRKRTHVASLPGSDPTKGERPASDQTQRMGGSQRRGWGGSGRSYLEGAAVAVELTAHLSFGALVLMAGELQEQRKA